MSWTKELVLSYFPTQDEFTKDFVLVAKRITHSRHTFARVIKLIWEKQTQDEKAIRDTRHRNNVGFNGADAQFLSSILESSNKYGGTLSHKQFYFAVKRMRKYTGQLADILNQKGVPVPEELLNRRTIEQQELTIKTAVVKIGE